MVRIPSCSSTCCSGLPCTSLSNWLKEAAIASVEVIVQADDSLRAGIVSLTHGFGLLPGETDYLRDGVCSNMLISTDRELQTINAMPRMTAFPLHVAKVASGRGLARTHAHTTDPEEDALAI